MSRLGKITRRAVRDRAILNIARLGLAACSDPFRGFFLPHSVTSSRQCICHQYSSALYWRVQTVRPHDLVNVVKDWLCFFFFLWKKKKLDKGQIWWMMSASCSRQKKKTSTYRSCKVIHFYAHQCFLIFFSLNHCSPARRFEFSGLAQWHITQTLQW